MDEVDIESKNTANSLNIKLFSMLEIENEGKNSKKEFPDQKSDDIMTIVYTRYIK
jgi:long-subunit acyl-CoA synthetase (AMP-forming)